MGNLCVKDDYIREYVDFMSHLNGGNVFKVAAQYQKQLKEMQNLPLDVAVTGDAGVGKSSFVNAFRGLCDDDEEAAEVGIGKETLEIKAYPHPSFPNIKLWDLPAIGTYKFKAAKYLKEVQFGRYDVFIMIISDRFTENAAMLAKEIQRMKKKFYYVRSRIDQTINIEMRRRNFNMEDTLASLRKYCERRLKEATGVSSSVYLISSYEVHMYDFPVLQERIAMELLDYKKDILTLGGHVFPEKEFTMKKELMRAKQKQRMKKFDYVTSKIDFNDEMMNRNFNAEDTFASMRQHCECSLKEMQNLPLDVAVIGNAGVGKSSFVNAIRGLTDDDEEAAEVVIETLEIKAYPHPVFPNIKLWDLPGIGTFKFKAANYLKEVQFEKYDVFIMIISDLFNENDAMLAKEIQRMKKKFYYVRSRIDQTINDEMRRRNYNMEDTLASVRKYCERRLKETTGVSSSVYLISSREVCMYDFPRLQERIATELPDHKKDILTLGVHVFPEKELMMKKELMLAKQKQRMKKFYYVTSKIDFNDEMMNRNFNAEDAFASMRQHCECSLKEAAGVSSNVYPISSYDFLLLQEIIATELPDHKKDILASCVHIFSEEELMMKKELVESYIKKVALISCACGLVAVPGFSMVCDVVILIDALRCSCRVFGLDNRSLRFLALQTGKEFEELRSAIKKTPLANSINAEFVFSLLMRSSLWVIVSLVELALDFIPVLGSVFGGASSYVTMYYFLNSFLDDAVEDAQNVGAKLLKQPKSQEKFKETS